jgi:hypothetical protein
MTATRAKKLRMFFIAVSILSLLATFLVWTTVVDRPLTKEYVEFVQRASSLSAEDRARQQAAIYKFDYSGVWREPMTYFRLFCPMVTVVCCFMVLRRWRVEESSR